MLHRFYKSMWKLSLSNIYILYRHVHFVVNVLTLDLFSVFHCLVLEPDRQPVPRDLRNLTLSLLVIFVILYCNCSAKVDCSNVGPLVRYVFLSYSYKTNSRKQHHYLLQIWLQQACLRYIRIYWLRSSRLSCRRIYRRLLSIHQYTRVWILSLVASAVVLLVQYASLALFILFIHIGCTYLVFSFMNS